MSNFKQLEINNIESSEFDNNENVKTEVSQVVEEKALYGTLPLSDENLRKRAYKVLMDRYESVLPYHDTLVNEWDTIEYQWQAISSSKNENTKSDICPTEIWNIVEDWTATIIDVFLGFSIPIDVKLKKTLRNRVMPPETARKMTSRIKKVLWQNAVETNFDEEFEIGIREGVKLGTFAFKNIYQLDETPQLKVVDYTENIMVDQEGQQVSIASVNRKKIEEYIDLEDRPILKNCNLRKLYFRNDKINWVIEKIESSWDKLDKLAKTANVYDNLGLAKKTSHPIGGVDDEIKEKNVDNSPAGTNLLASLDGDVELLEGHHIPFTFLSTDNVPEELKGKTVLCIITVANQKEVIRIQPSPYRKLPYSIVPFVPQPGSVYGLGIPKVLQKLFMEISTRSNQSLDANTFGLYGMIAYNKRKIAKPEQLKIRPAGVIELKDIQEGASVRDVLEFIRPPVEYVSAGLQLINISKSEVVRASRLKGVMSGEKVTPNPSATEISSIMREALKSLKIIFKRIDRNIIKEYFEQAYRMMILNRQKSWFIEMQDLTQELNSSMGSPMFQGSASVIEEITPQEIYTDGIDIEVLGVTRMVDAIENRFQNMQLIDLFAKVMQAQFIDDSKQEVKPNLYKVVNDALISFGKEQLTDYWIKVPASTAMPPITGDSIGGSPSNLTAVPPMAQPNMGENPTTVTDMLKSVLSAPYANMRRS